MQTKQKKAITNAEESELSANQSENIRRVSRQYNKDLCPPISGERARGGASVLNNGSPLRAGSASGLWFPSLGKALIQVRLGGRK